jgi:DNA repair exonuclease SbcCD ATPase subunit
MDPATALVVGAAALITALVGVARLKRETPDLNVSRLNSMLDRYVEDSERLVDELARERGRAERLEQELVEERTRASKVIAEKQQALEDCLRRIGQLEEQKERRDQQVLSLLEERREMRQRLGEAGAG